MAFHQYDSDGLGPLDATNINIMNLISGLFPHVLSSSQLKVEKIGEGSYNRVYGVTILPAEARRDSATILTNRIKGFFAASRKSREYVVRFPHDRELTGDALADQILREISTLQVINSRLHFPTPQVVDYSVNSANVLGKPFVLQTRLRGQCLYDLWRHLNAKQRASAVKQITKITEQIASVTAHRAGTISTENLGFPNMSRIEVDPFPVPGPYRSADLDLQTPRTGSTSTQTPFQWMIEQHERWTRYEYSIGQNNQDVWMQLIDIAKLLQRRGWLGNTFHLVHNDLFPRNIMASIKDTSTVEITGIVDWDFACFAPKCAALTVPSWTWELDRGEVLLDESGHQLPTEEDEKNTACREAFHDSASVEFKRFASSHDSFIAQRVYAVFGQGLKAPSMRSVATKTILQWSELHPEE
jgi:aminoglycoside phosphotransferase (APT) family kinase protein